MLSLSYQNLKLVLRGPIPFFGNVSLYLRRSFVQKNNVSKQPPLPVHHHPYRAPQVNSSSTPQRPQASTWSSKLRCWAYQGMSHFTRRVCWLWHQGDGVHVHVCIDMTSPRARVTTASCRKMAERDGSGLWVVVPLLVPRDFASWFHCCRRQDYLDISYCALLTSPNIDF